MIKAGFYEADITPAIGMERPGNYFKVFIEEIREELKVHAAFLTDGENQLALVSIDTCSVTDELYQQVKSELPGMAVVLSATHTHNGGPVRTCTVPEYYSDFARKLLTEESIWGYFVLIVIKQTLFLDILSCVGDLCYNLNRYFNAWGKCLWLIICFPI